jgi:ABC-type Fe3+-hydroxamate transport system substrate-binding protein
MSRRTAASAAVCFALAVTGAACSSSSSGTSASPSSTAKICQKLVTDSKPLETQTTTPGTAQITAALNTVATRFTVDVANASDPKFKAGVEKVATTLKATATALTASVNPDQAKLTADLQGAETYLDKACTGFN